MMASYSPLRTPWTTALLVLLIIWSVWLLGMPDSPRNPIEPVGRPPPTLVAYKGANAQETDSWAQAEPTKPSNSITEVYQSSHVPTDVAASGQLTNLSATDDGLVYSTSASDPLLILYAYAETPNARSNLKFFIEHGLHGGGDFIFIFNGDTDAESLLPTHLLNVKYVKRENTCFDLGAYAEVLTNENLYQNYKRFILMNASIRGPFVPVWAEGCWSEMYMKRVTQTTKLVGMTANCWPSFHVQSMIWATDYVGISLLLFPPKDDTKEEDEQPVGINKCFEGWKPAVQAEIGASAIILNAGYKLDVMMTAFHGYDYMTDCNSEVNGDVLWNGKYEGTNVHPYETIFMKTNRNIDPIMIKKLTQWTNGRKYSSWDNCPSL